MAVRLALAPLVLVLACQDVSIGRQIPRDAAVDVRRELVLPMPDAQLTLRALDVAPGGELVLLAQFDGTADFGDGEAHTASSTRGDGVLLIFEPDGSLRAKQVLSAEFLTLYRATLDGDAIHVTGLFRGSLSDGESLGSSPSSQSAIALRYGLDGTRMDARPLGSSSGFGNVQGKGVDGQDGRLLRCGNYLDAIDPGDGPVVSAGIAGDNAYVTVADGSTTAWTDALTTPESGVRGAYGQNCAFAPDGGVLVALDFDGLVSVHGTDHASQGGLDGMVVAYDPDGAPRWVSSIGANGDQQLNPLAIRTDSLLVGGTSSGPFELDGMRGDEGVFVVAMDLTGSPRWVWSGSGAHAVTALDGSGIDTVVSGLFDGPVDALGWEPVGGRDGFVAGLDDDGAIRWSHTFGSGADDACLGHASGAEVAVVCAFGAALESPGGTAIPDGGALWIGHVAVER